MLTVFAQYPKKSKCLNEQPFFAVLPINAFSMSVAWTKYIYISTKDGMLKYIFSVFMAYVEFYKTDYSQASCFQSNGS